MEEQFADHQADDVLGAHDFSHLEVRNTCRTFCTEAADSQVCKHTRTQNINSLDINWMPFYVRIVSHTWKNNQKFL